MHEVILLKYGEFLLSVTTNGVNGAVIISGIPEHPLSMRNQKSSFLCSQNVRVQSCSFREHLHTSMPFQNPLRFFATANSFSPCSSTSLIASRLNATSYIFISLFKQELFLFYLISACPASLAMVTWLKAQF
jgi:hypothetical protein